MYFLPLLALQCVFADLLNLQGLKIQKHDNSIVMNGPHPESQEPVNLLDVADFLTRSFWSGSLSEESNLKIGAQGPSANLMVVSFGTDTPQESLEGKPSDLTYDFFPADRVSLLTSLATSKHPNSHGVVGETWYVDDEPVDAYSGADAFSSKLTFPQLIGSTHAETKVIAASADSQLASSFTQDSYPVDSLTEDNFESNHGLGFSKADLNQEMETNDFWVKLKPSLEKLDQNEPLVANFLMEVEYIRRLADSMTSASEPVLYNVATTTPSHQGAQKILEAALNYVTAQFNSQHPTGSSQLVFMKEPVVVQNDKTTKMIPHHHAKEFITQSCSGDGSSTSVDCGDQNDSGTTVTGARIYQFGIWLFVFAALIILWFVNSVLGMQYETDSTLFTKWNRKSDRKAGMGRSSAPGLGVMGANDLDMRAFNRRT